MLDEYDDMACYTSYFKDQFKICSMYFQNSFDSFLKPDSNVSLVKRTDSVLKDNYYIIFDNSLSKREFIDESNWPVKLSHSLTFELASMEDYRSHKSASRLT